MFCSENVCVEDSDDIGMPKTGQHDRLSQHVLNFLDGHASPLEHLRRLPSQESMFDAKDLGEGALTEESFYFVAVPNNLSLLEKRHKCFSAVGPCQLP